MFNDQNMSSVRRDSIFGISNFGHCELFVICDLRFGI